MADEGELATGGDEVVLSKSVVELRGNVAELRAQNQALRGALRRILQQAEQVPSNDVGAAWRALGAIEAMARWALENSGGR